MEEAGLKCRQMDFWRRIILLTAIVIGSMLIFYKVPALLTVSPIEFAVQRQREGKSAFGLISKERKRLQALSLEDYINEKTQGKIVFLESADWQSFFEEIHLTTAGQREAKYAKRISSRDADRLETKNENGFYAAPVFFSVNELPLAEWGLLPKAGEFVYLAMVYDGGVKYLRLEYRDYLTVVNPMNTVYPEPPRQLYYPYRNAGLGVLAIGVLSFFFLPKSNKQDDIIEYQNSRLIAGDMAAAILLLLFLGLPFLINGGTVQAVKGWWGLSLVFWFLALGPLIIMYASAVYASFYVRIGEHGLNVAKKGGEREYRYEDIVRVERLELRNPAWFRKLFFWVLALSALSGRGVSAGSAGSFFLSEAARYEGFSLSFKDGKIQYIWTSDAFGNVLLPGYERILQVLAEKGIPCIITDKVVEKFLPLP